MNLRGKMAAAGVAVVLTAGAAAADSGPHHGDGDRMGTGMHGDMMQMMMRMHGMMGGGGMMPGMGMMGGQMGMSPGMGMMGPMGIMSDMDGDGDGVVTPEEARAAFGNFLTEYDANGDGTLSIEEFETLHSALIREMVVDRFQHLDADGDGAITEEEMQAPALKTQLMQGGRAHMTDGSGSTPGHMMGGGGRMQDN